MFLSIIRLLLRALYSISTPLMAVGLPLLTLISFKFAFGILVFTCGFVGPFVFCWQAFLPESVVDLFTYGKHARNVSGLQYHVPKRWFKHFYLFAAFWTTIWFTTAVLLYTGLIDDVPTQLMSFLDYFYPRRVCKASSANGFLAITLFTMQCWRRFYETHFVSAFSSKTKITLLQYIIGFIHYFACPLSIVMEAPGFSRRCLDHDVTPNFLDISIAQYAGAILFLSAWVMQFECAQILANLRKNEEGVVVTEVHQIPYGGLFEFISSPHMLCEIIIYSCLQGILVTNTIFPYIFLWVATNQFGVALLTHKWYQDTFPSYPKNRFALIPLLL